MPSHDEDEVRLLKERLARLEAERKGEPRTMRAASGFKGGLFGCLGVIVAGLLLLVFVASIGECSRSSAPKQAGNVTAETGASTDQRSASSNGGSSSWVYSSYTDAIHEGTTKKACTTSKNEVTQDFPYQNTDARLCIRSGPQGADAYVELNSNGQILCGIEGCGIAVRADNNPAKSYPGVGASDNSTNIVFLRHTQSLISEIRKSRTLAIEVRLYQNGDQALLFNTQGLKWP